MAQATLLKQEQTTDQHDSAPARCRCLMMSLALPDHSIGLNQPAYPARLGITSRLATGFETLGNTSVWQHLLEDAHCRT
jgi:hypothetical protein